MDLQTLSTIAGLISIGVTFFGAIFVVRSNIGKSTNEAQQSALSAMKEEMDVLRRRIDDREKESKRLERIIDTICAALKSKGINITIYGEVINIEVEDGKKSTTIRIHDEKGN